MAWTLYLLAQHPAVERQLCAELEALGLLATPQVGLGLPGAARGWGWRRAAQRSAEGPCSSQAGQQVGALRVAGRGWARHCGP